MVGIAFSQNNQELQLLLKGMHHFSWQKIETCKNVHIGICKLDKFGGIFENYFYSIVIDGYVHNYNFDQIIESFENVGKNFAKNLEGEFSMIFFVKKTEELYVIMDRMGQNRCYYTFSEDGLLVSSETKAIANVINPSFDVSTVYTMIHFRKIFGDRTLFDNIKSLMPGYIIHYQIKNKKFNLIQVEKYVYEPIKIREDELVNKATNLLKTALQKRYAESKKNAIALSGGLDSRLGAVLLKNKKIQAFTFGTGEDPDSVVGEKIAQKLNVPHTLIKYNFKDEHIVNLSEFCCYIQEGLTSISNCFGLYVCDQLQDKIDTWFHFVGLDVVLGGNYIGKFDDEIYEQNSLVELLKKFSVLNDEESQKLILKKIDIKSLLEEHLKFVSIKNKEAALENALLLDAMHRNSAALKLSRNFFSVRNPTFDKKFLDFISKVPLEDRRDHKLENKILEFVDRDLANIPSATTGLKTSSGKFEKFFMKNKLRYNKFKQIYLKKDISEKNMLIWI